MSVELEVRLLGVGLAFTLHPLRWKRPALARWPGFVGYEVGPLTVDLWRSLR